MADVVDKTTRSVMMSGIRGKDTQPELLVRSFLHSKGFRYRLHVKELPGRPDIVLPKYRTVIFVHGCFWHQHSGCRNAVMPKSNVTFWRDKLESNVNRDKRNIAALRKDGWQCLTIWECEIESRSKLNTLVVRLRSQIM